MKVPLTDHKRYIYIYEHTVMQYFILTSCNLCLPTDLKSLEFLDLSINKLVEVPSSVWDLTGLTNLYLGDNRLAEVQTYRIENLVSIFMLLIYEWHCIYSEWGDIKE